MFKIRGYKLNNNGKLISIFEQLTKTLDEAKKKIEEIQEFGYNNYEITFKKLIITKNFIGEFND